MKIAVASGKGGTGKTLLSVNLALFLAQRHKTVLVDLDVEEPNDALFVKGRLKDAFIVNQAVPQWDAQKCTMCGICPDNCVWNAVVRIGDKIMVYPQLCHSCYACSELCPDDALPMVPYRIGQITRFDAGTMDFVEGRLDIGQEMPVPLIAETKKYVQNNFLSADFIVYDSPPGTSCPVIEAVKDADFVILISEDTPFGLNDLQLAVETVRELKLPFGVVINRYGIGEKMIEKYCNKQKIRVIAKIPNKRKIAETYSHGQTVFDKDSDLSQQLTEIEKFLLAL